MFEELIGKIVTVNMVAATSGTNTMTSCSYTGQILSVKDNFIKMLVEKSYLTYDAAKNMTNSAFLKSTEIDKIMYFNVNLLSYIKVE